MCRAKSMASWRMRTTSMTCPVVARYIMKCRPPRRWPATWRLRRLGRDFVARDASWRVGAGFKRRYGVSELGLVDARLPLAESRPRTSGFERSPFPPRHRRELSSASSSSVPRSRDSLIANSVEVSDQRRGVSKFFELAAVKRADTELSGGAERCEFRRFLHFPVFDQTQAFAHDLAGVLITPTLHQGLDERFLPLGQDNVACRHENTSS